MSAYTVLADLGQSLVDLLGQEFRNDSQLRDMFTSPSNISLASPYDVKDDNSVRLSVYLYRIIEDPNTKNQYPVEGRAGRLRKPPLTLDLLYLVTPLVNDPGDRHRILGKVMQVFYDRAILQGPDLSVDTLAKSGEEFRIILNPVSLEETTRVWQALEMSYRLSVCYMVRVALVDSTVEEFKQPVVQRKASFGEKPPPVNGGL